jgi:hypothetical protein
VLEEMQGSSSVCISKPNGSPKQLWDFEGDGKIRSKTGKHLLLTGSAFLYKLTMASRIDSSLGTFRIIPVFR